jgi:ubiquinone/menaquinone biosynthesis C-methylase UbiE
MPDSIFQLLGGMLAAKHLFVANELGVFEALGAQPMTLDELAERTSTPARTLRIVVDAMAAAGFLTRDAERYANGPVAAAFLSGSGPADLRPVLRLWDKIVYPQWGKLEEAVRSGASTLGQLPQTEQEIFSTGIAALTARSAHALATTYDFSRHRRVLDIGGGVGSFLTTIARHHKQLKLTLFELPHVARIVRERAAGGSPSPIKIVEGDLFKDQLPKGHDAILLSNVVHLFSPARNHTLFERVARTAAPNARLLLVDFWTDPTHTQPPFAAYMAGEFQIVTGEGDVYSRQEVECWLAATGWRLVEQQPLAGAASLLVAERAS